MRDFDDSTLWSYSEFESMRARTGTSGFARLDDASVLSETLLDELRRLEPHGVENCPVEVVAACIRHREPALLCFQCDGLVWPVTLFPAQALYHSPRDIRLAEAAALNRLTLASAEPPGVRPPGHWMHERIANTESYRALAPLLWTLALKGPRADLLHPISDPAAFRALRNPEADHGSEEIALGGALGSAAQRLRRETVPVRTIATWPGMSLERACRMLNGLYLTSALLVSRSHPDARPAPSPSKSWRGAKPGR